VAVAVDLMSLLQCRKKAATGGAAAAGAASGAAAAAANPLEAPMAQRRQQAGDSRRGWRWRWI